MDVDLAGVLAVLALFIALVAGTLALIIFDLIREGDLRGPRGWPGPMGTPGPTGPRGPKGEDGEVVYIERTTPAEPVER